MLSKKSQLQNYSVKLSTFVSFRNYKTKLSNIVHCVWLFGCPTVFLFPDATSYCPSEWVVCSNENFNVSSTGNLQSKLGFVLCSHCKLENFIQITDWISLLFKSILAITLVTREIIFLEAGKVSKGVQKGCQMGCKGITKGFQIGSKWFKRNSKGVQKRIHKCSKEISRGFQDSKGFRWELWFFLLLEFAKQTRLFTLS